jgi:hypothetical protein
MRGKTAGPVREHNTIRAELGIALNQNPAAIFFPYFAKMFGLKAGVAPAA